AVAGPAAAAGATVCVADALTASWPAMRRRAWPMSILGLLLYPVGPAVASGRRIPAAEGRRSQTLVPSSCFGNHVAHRLRRWHASTPHIVPGAGPGSAWPGAA